MDLYIGGSYQGQLEIAKKDHPEISWIDGATCTMEDLFRAQGVYDFHKFIRHQMMEQKEIQEDTIFQRNPSLVIVSDEVGYGVVPVDSFERAWREKVGRVCTYLAANSTRVVRVVCGIGTVIKEETLKSEILKEEI